jgi:hypothetical protein
MNCAECKELLVAYIEGLLDKSKKQAAEEHLKDCRICQAELGQLTNLHDRLTKNGNTLALSNLENDVMNKILREQNVRLKAVSKAGITPKLRRIIMKSPITKLAAAAVIIVAVLVGVHHLGSPIESVALADVLERIEQVQAFMYRMKMKMTGNMMPNMPIGEQEMETTVIISNEFGVKMDVQMTNSVNGRDMAQQMYFIPAQKTMLTVIPEQKKYMRMEFDDDILERLKKQNNDPRETIKQIMRCKYTELGRSIIDGIEVDGFETNDPKFMAGMAEKVNVKLWVDAETWLPVRAEMDIRMNEQMQMRGVMYDYQWDILVSASEFDPVIPEDYTAFPTDGIKIPSMNEESVIEGLKLFAEIIGKYPENLNVMTIVQDFMKLKDSNTPAAKQFQEELRQLPSEEERTKKMMEMMVPVQSLGMIYTILVQEQKEPAYYGDSVNPEDSGKVLMRWKESEDNYRVIFGDLTISDVTSEELAELESLLEQ